MKKWYFLLAALLLLPLSACGGSEDESCLRGRVAEVQRGADGLPSALILDLGDGEQEGVLWDEATQWALPPAAAELSPAEVWEDPLGMEVTVYLSPEAGPGSLTARNGTEFSDAGTADFLTVDEIRLPEFLTLSDGTEAEIWVDFWGDRSYRLSGGTELLRERPQDMDFPTYYVEGDTPLTALPSALLEGVAAYYQERGDIYDIQEEVERAYQAFRQSEDPEQFSNFLVEQRVGWAATAPGVYYFRTTVILPVREQEITEHQFTDAFNIFSGPICPLNRMSWWCVIRRELCPDRSPPVSGGWTTSGWRTCCTPGPCLRCGSNDQTHNKPAPWDRLSEYLQGSRNF